MSRDIKKVRMGNTSQPPSRRFLQEQFDLQLWKDLNGLQHGRSSGSEAIDNRLRKKFGQFHNDPNGRQFRTEDGRVMAPPDDAIQTPITFGLRPIEEINEALGHDSGTD